MFDHVTIRASERTRSERFYRTVLGALELSVTAAGAAFVEWGDFSITQASDERAPTTGVHIGFAAPTREHVDAFWEAGSEAGYVSDGRPGSRPEYSEDYYGAFLLDPDGNSAEAVTHGTMRAGAVVDHIWLRVADVARSRAFYQAIAPHGGFRVSRDGDDRSAFRALGGGSLSVLPGEPRSANLHIAFPAARNEIVNAFHGALTAAGHPSNGAPGERRDYHPGYYGAFVCDPDGHNVEVVCHNR